MVGRAVEIQLGVGDGPPAVVGAENLLEVADPHVVALDGQVLASEVGLGQAQVVNRGRELGGRVEAGVDGGTTGQEWAQRAPAGAGGDGVAEDLAFHRSIADAARNPFLLDTLNYLSQYLRGATRVTRANEARRVDFAAQVADEHRDIVDAIEAGDPQRARAAAAAHMNNAIRRIGMADPAFWQQEGEVLARPLTAAKPA